ncbi:MAG: chemotaxis protein CheA [Micavibrio sp.]|nr:chemotaxis protein CheA [Micavibrio sp.]
MDDLLQEFLTDTTENLGALDLDLVQLEQNPRNAELIARIFRLVHTVKGNCGFLNLPRLENVAHHAEGVLGRYRSGALTVTPDSVSVILQSLDRIKSIVGGLAATGNEPAGDDTALIHLLDLIGTAPEPAVPPPATLSAEDIAARTLRIHVDTLEDIMTVVSELVLTRNQLEQARLAGGVPAFHAPLDRLSRAVTQLQDSVMRARLQPLQNALARLPRLVRDLAADLNKKIRLDIKGEDTELDRQVLELVRDPLTHLVRNAADHGIETPAARAAVGKAPEGIIRIHARHAGGQVIIDVSDDGRGFSIPAISRKALEKGLVTPDKLRAMTDRQVQELVFTAGFSTAESISAVSGRGVGMDVVRANLDKMGGTIDIHTIAGEGTKFTLRIPLTIAIVPALIFSIGGARYAMAQAHVQEVLQLAQSSKHKIETIAGAGFLRLRSQMLPIVDLRGVSGNVSSSGTYVLVISGTGGSYGLLADDISGTEEIVVKPVARLLRHVRLYAGNAVLGDGGVAFILDPAAVPIAAGVEPAADKKSPPVAPMAQQHYLLLRLNGADCALPLDDVSQLARLQPGMIERTAFRAVIQQGQGMTPVLHAVKNAAGNKKIIYLHHNGQQAAMVVDDLLDIVAALPNLTPPPQPQAGLAGSAVIAGRALDVLDAAYFIALAQKGGGYAGG